MFSKRKIYIFISKILFCIIITLIVLINIKISPTFKNNFYKRVFETNISFAQINKFYEKYAGSSIPFKDFFVDNSVSVFNENLNFKEKSKYLDGVELKVEDNYLIPSLDDGLVIFVGKKESYGNTVIVGQSDGIDVWYSNIDNAAVSLYSNIKKGELIGNSKGDKIYLVFKKDGQILDYEDYI